MRDNIKIESRRLQKWLHMYMKKKKGSNMTLRVINCNKISKEVLELKNKKLKKIKNHWMRLIEDWRWQSKVHLKIDQ